MKKNTSPAVSVIIATYNSRSTLEKCLSSIAQQTYSHIEIIVVDGMGYDPAEQKLCKEIAGWYGQYYQDGPERSIQRNRGITQAKGEYVLIIDQDMYLSPTVVEECVASMETGKYAALLIPEISIGSGYWTEVVALERYISIFLETSPNECCRFVRTKDARSVGGYDPTIVGAEDSDFHYKCASLGEIGKITSVIYHDEGVTSFWGRVKKKYYYSQAFRAYLHRYPTIAVKQFFPIKKHYLKHWRLLLAQPHISCGIIILRSCEVIAGALGMLLQSGKKHA